MTTLQAHVQDRLSIIKDIEYTGHKLLRLNKSMKAGTAKDIAIKKLENHLAVLDTRLQLSN